MKTWILYLIILSLLIPQDGWGQKRKIYKVLVYTKKPFKSIPLEEKTFIDLNITTNTGYRGRIKGNLIKVTGSSVLVEKKDGKQLYILTRDIESLNRIGRTYAMHYGYNLYQDSIELTRYKKDYKGYLYKLSDSCIQVSKAPVKSIRIEKVRDIKVLVKTEEGSFAKMKGRLVGVTDSTIQIKTKDGGKLLVSGDQIAKILWIGRESGSNYLHKLSPEWIEYGRDPEVKSYSISEIGKISFRREGAVGKGVAIGGATGSIIGLAVGLPYDTKDPPPFFIPITLVTLPAGLILGTAIGAASGSKEKVYHINGDHEKYLRIKPDLEQYLIYLQPLPDKPITRK